MSMRIPHVRSWSPFGHTSVNPDVLKEYTKNSGIASFWLGSVLVYIVTDNRIRLALHDERKIGVIDQSSVTQLKGFFGENGVMHNFPNFQDLHSDTYKHQRSYLMRHFHRNIQHRISDIIEALEGFDGFEGFEGFEGLEPDWISDPVYFSNIVVLRVISKLIGLTIPLDGLYRHNKDFRYACSRVAQYGISEKYDPKFEQLLIDLFPSMIKDQYLDVISNPNSLLVNIIPAVPPQSYEELEQLPSYHQIVMAFWAIAMGAGAHSTSTTLACALRDMSKATKLALIRAANSCDADQIDEYNSNGKLFEITVWVLENLAINPAFPYQFYQVHSDIIAPVTPDQVIELPKGCFILNDYRSCHYSEFKTSDDFRAFLMSLPHPTVRSFANSNRVAAFGGTLRRCPGRDTSIYEQLIIITKILRTCKICLEK